MVLLLGEFAISWIILRLFAKKDLSAIIGLPTKARLVDLLFGFTSSSVCAIIAYFVLSSLVHASWSLNTEYSVGVAFASTWWTLQSVLMEEFLFRGALLYLLIQTFGKNRSCFISAVAFGIYHWFSYNAFGNPGQMVYVLILTGIGGLMFAYAFARTGSLYLPIALHFGWNLMTIVVFSQGPLGNQLLVHEGGNQLSATEQIIIFLLQTIPLPVLTFLYLRRLERHE